ncbi:hypothetical protein Hanom_Chr16g01477071 [Helianthus anomalus]
MVIKPRNLVCMAALVVVVAAFSSVRHHTDPWQKLLTDSAVTLLSLPFSFKKSKTAPKCGTTTATAAMLLIGIQRADVRFTAITGIVQLESLVILYLLHQQVTHCAVCPYRNQSRRIISHLF